MATDARHEFREQGHGMDRDERAQARDVEDRQLLAIRRLEREMTNDEHDLERRLDHFAETIEHAERTIDADRRVEGFRQEP